MWPRRLVLISALSMLVAMPGAGRAASSGSVLTVSGSGNTTGTLVLRSTTTLYLDMTRGGLTLSGGKTYVGLAVHDGRGVLLAAAVQPREFRAGDESWLMWVGPPRPQLVLEPGRYRLTLLGDGPGSAKLGTTGTTGAMRVSTRARAAGVAASSFSLKPAAVPVSTGGAELDVVEGSTLSISTFRQTAGPAHEEEWFCFRLAPATCSATDNDQRMSSTQVSLGDQWTSSTSISTSPMPAGRYLTAAGAATVSTSNSHAGFAITIPGAPDFGPG